MKRNETDAVLELQNGDSGSGGLAVLPETLQRRNDITK